jgi:dihydroflavonol-4-reductase
VNVFMTGANGFVGLNIVAALKAAGHRVTALVRAKSKVTYLEPFGVTIVRGELGNPADVTAARRGRRDSHRREHELLHARPADAQRS